MSRFLNELAAGPVAVIAFILVLVWVLRWAFEHGIL